MGAVVSAALIIIIVILFIVFAVKMGLTLPIILADIHHFISGSLVLALPSTPHQVVGA